MRIADHSGDAWKGRQLLGRALRVAAGNDDFCGGILTMYAPYCGASVPVGCLSNGASVQDDKIGRSRAGSGCEALGGEAALQFGAIRLGRPAAEVVHKVTGHGSIINSSSLQPFFPL